MPKVTAFGMRAAAARLAPNPALARVIVRSRGRSRRAESRAPVTDPIAMTDDSMPNSPAPSPNSMRAIAEMKIAKLNPIVPRIAIIVSTSRMSGRRRT